MHCSEDYVVKTIKPGEIREHGWSGFMMFPLLFSSSASCRRGFVWFNFSHCIITVKRNRWQPTSIAAQPFCFWVTLSRKTCFLLLSLKEERERNFQSRIYLHAKFSKLRCVSYTTRIRDFLWSVWLQHSLYICVHQEGTDFSESIINLKTG